jgi:hypothetical protein
MMADEGLKARTLARMNTLLAEPEIAGDIAKALFVACGMLETLPEFMENELVKILAARQGALKIRPKRGLGAPKKHGSLIPGKVKVAALIAMHAGRHRGLNNKKAAEYFLNRANEGQALRMRLADVKNLQKRIQEAISQAGRKKPVF